MPWYKSEPLAILALFICPPLGVVLTLFQRWDPIVKAVASLFSLSGSVVLLLVVASLAGGSEVAASPKPAAIQAAAPLQVAGSPAAAVAAQPSTGPIISTQAPPQPAVA